MDQINLVIADLQLVAAILETKSPDKARLKAALQQAAEDLKTATAALTGIDGGGGETKG